ncbi:MAG: GNAT family N-acetyltransferase [Colwellia sp.]|nr:GNAT family N-acetyltransferase [Colwellia sp.]MCW8865333.1 GNAT family N-acetyltransferase [Colwellia sp.]MCW9080354.1 GNAT family N-acetyltransferase [Colwellia sp.]
MTTSANIIYTELTPQYFKQVIKLGNKVHGDGYLTQEKLTDWTARGISKKINCGFVAIAKFGAKEELVGFRITFAAEHWQVDEWCSPKLWKIAEDKCCYFKCNTVDESYRGFGIGKKLLQLSSQAAKKQGAQAGIAHLWKQSPNNSAVAYFTHCGGELVKSHPDKWNEESKQGYNCILCGHDCHCEAAEMIIRFK